MSKLMKSFFAVGIFLSAFGIIGVSAGGGYYGHNTKLGGSVGFAESFCDSNYTKGRYTLQRANAAGAVYVNDTAGRTLKSCSVSVNGNYCDAYVSGTLVSGYNHQHSFGDALLN